MNSALKISLLWMFFAFPGTILALEPLQIKSFSGAVEYRSPSQDEWKKVEKGTKLSDGGTIRTGQDGRATLLFENKSMVWLKPGTDVDVKHDPFKLTKLFLKLGSLKVRVPHLKRKEHFEVRTPTTVAAVRGTIFTIENIPDTTSADKEQKAHTNIGVLFGRVTLQEDGVGNEGHGLGRAISLTQGTSYDEGRVALLTREKELAGLENWSPEINDDSRRQTLRENAEKRAEIGMWSEGTVAQVRSDINNLTGRQKEDDFATGRTLTDVHGNLVRVDQRLDRPDDHTLQVLNVVKRSGYQANGLRQYAYHGPTSSRIDALIAKAEFNTSLPGQINDFPGFFGSNRDVKVDRASLVVANMGDSSSIFTMGFFGKRNPNSGSDSIDSDLYIGTLNDRSNLFGLRLDDTNNVPGLTHFIKDSRIGEIKKDGANGELYRYSSTRWQQAADPNQVLWVATENFAIDNSGKVRNVSDFTGGVNDLGNLIKNTAGEVAVFAKAHDSSFSLTDPNGRPSNSEATNFSGGNAQNKNLDLVILPDLAYSVLKTIATSGDVLKTTY